ncbi:ATP-binding cassette domain-containing protein [Erysipelothrix sp. D19-032]
MSEFDARRMLAQFGFYQSDVYKPIRYLSGGEKVRIKLMEIMHRKHNLIILDEPTNHLDIQSREILEEVLMQYQGTLIVVTMIAISYAVLMSKILKSKRELCSLFFVI